MTTAEPIRGASASSGEEPWSPAKAWLRALELTAAIPKNPERILSTVIEERARTYGDAPALLSDGESLSYRELAERSNQYARWAPDQGLTDADVVCLLMPNRPEYAAIWLGITRTGCSVSLLNTNLTGDSLAHSIRIVAPKHIIVAAELMDQLWSALPEGNNSAEIWVYGEGQRDGRRLDKEIENYSRETIGVNHVTISQRALCIYTSGTSGLPKAANVSHGRLMQWSHWFAGMMRIDSADRLYNCLPMYHSVGGVLATCAVLTAGGSVAIRRSFSASQFWKDIARWDCTLFQYIGELCRYLLHTEVSPEETNHRIRMCCGNGLRGDIWEAFRSRFHVPRVLEFYAATESNVSLFNVEGKPGSIGRIPPYLAHRFPATLVKFDERTEEPVRDQAGFCIRCAVNETGEAIGKILKDKSDVANHFEGYTSKQASEEKILRNVFEPGDAWFRTGDLMRKDEKGYFYFVDRIGDTFRWKGENVSTSEVAEAICAFPGIDEAIVYGVSVAGADGKAGMAALVSKKKLDLTALREHLAARLPRYAQPMFLRVRKNLEITSTFKYNKLTLAGEGYNPEQAPDEIYFNQHESGAFVSLDAVLYQRLQLGLVRI